MSIQPYEKSREEWKDGKSGNTPVMAVNLNHIEQGIYENSANIIDLENKITSGFSVIDIEFNNVEVKTRSVYGLYYGTVASLESIGIYEGSIVSLTIIGFENSNSMFNVCITGDKSGIGIYSDSSQTISSLTLRVGYISAALNPTLIAENKFTSIQINNQTDSGLYYASLTTLEDMGIPEDATVIGILAVGWSNFSSSFQLTLSDDKKEVIILTEKFQSNGNSQLSVRVAYQKVKESGGGSGEENKINSIKVNGETQQIAPDKSVDIEVPTKTSELDNDSNFVTQEYLDEQLKPETENIDFSGFFI